MMSLMNNNLLLELLSNHHDVTLDSGTIINSISAGVLILIKLYHALEVFQLLREVTGLEMFLDNQQWQDVQSITVTLHAVMLALGTSIFHHID